MNIPDKCHYAKLQEPNDTNTPWRLVCYDNEGDEIAEVSIPDYLTDAIDMLFRTYFDRITCDARKNMYNCKRQSNRC